MAWSSTVPRRSGAFKIGEDIRNVFLFTIPSIIIIHHICWKVILLESLTFRLFCVFQIRNLREESKAIREQLAQHKRTVREFGR